MAAGAKLIDDVKSKSRTVDWIDQLVIDRVDRKGLSDPLINAIFKMDDKVLPALTGLYDSRGEFIIVQLNKVVTEKVEDKDSFDTYYNEYIAMIIDEIDLAFMTNLKANADLDF